MPHDLDVQTRLTHKIRVFASLAGLLGAYRMGDEEAPLLLCCQALIPALSCMRPKPVPRPNEREFQKYANVFSRPFLDPH